MAGTSYTINDLQVASFTASHCKLMLVTLSNHQKFSHSITFWFSSTSSYLEGLQKDTAFKNVCAKSDKLEGHSQVHRK